MNMMVTNMVLSSRFLRAVLCAAVVVFAAACASRPPDERVAMRLAQFEAAAAAPVDSFKFWDLDDWESLGDTALVVWTQPKEAWLLRVSGTCNELEWAHGIGLTSSMRRVYARFDAVLAGDQRCRIVEIRPVDTTQVKRYRGSPERS